MKKTKPFISIIIPVFNEKERLDNLREIPKYFKRFSFSFEVIVVNDGSTDSTLALLKKLIEDINLKIITYRNNRGKGYAIKRAMLEANGNYRLFTDVDLSTPLSEFRKFLPKLKKYDLITSSRKRTGAKFIKHQSPIRENLGRGFTLLSQLVLNTNVSDFTCGFKCFSEKAALEIFTRLTINRWGFDSEIFYIAKKRGLTFKEVPVVWKNDPNTKVKFPQVIYQSFWELLKIRINDIQGLYS